MTTTNKPTTTMMMGGLSFAEYLKLPAVNWSTLKEIAKSPRHYLHRLREALPDDAALRLGRVAHTAILEPDRMPLDFAVFTGARRQGKVWDAFEAANAGRTIIKQNEYAQAIAMRDAVRSHPQAGRYFRSGRAEHTIVWADEATGIPCKARVDWIDDETGTLVDLKTSADIEMRRFGSIAARFGYHCQIAWYLRGLSKALGMEMKSARIIAVESEPPHDVGVFIVDEDTIYAGGEECDELLARVRECAASNVWPGRYADEEPLQLPAWWYAEAEEATGLGVAIGGA